MIARVHASTGERQSLETWLEALIGDRDARTRLTETLRRHARPIILAGVQGFTRFDGRQGMSGRGEGEGDHCVSA